MGPCKDCKNWGSSRTGDHFGPSVTMADIQALYELQMRVLLTRLRNDPQ